MNYIFLLVVLMSVALQGVVCVTPPENYNIIGPFVMGEREEGVDTLESYGGIFNLKPDNRTFPSELGNGGVVGWSTASPDTQNNVQISYPGINWNFLQSVFGWSIWLWYGYAVGTFEVSTPGRYIVQCTGVRQFWIDNILFLGDFYSYGVGGHPVQLNSGTHSVILRLSSSVRLTQSPIVNFNFQILDSPEEDIIVVGDSTVPSIINGYPVSPYISVTVTNIYENWIVVTLFSNDTSLGLEGNPATIAPGQKFSLSATLSPPRPFSSCNNIFSISIEYSNAGKFVSIPVNFTFNCVSFGSSSYSFTFLDFDNTVQYASVVPPANKCAGSCGVMVATHGAGVEASSPAWTGAIPQLANLWLLFPTGRRPWGYDWESSSRVNVFTSLNYLAQYLPGVPGDVRDNFTVDSSRLFYVGHSMGGHGCWSLASHYGDQALGAACAAGFVKLQFYVFYNMKAGDSYIDPVLRGILDASIAENDNDIYSTNIVGIPTIARYGQNDSNVNPWHSRRMARMVDEESGDNNFVTISEVPNQNHWFTGVLGDEFMVNFYSSHDTSLPELPSTFTLSTINPASFGGRGNLVILQLSIPFRLGRITVTQNSGEWVLNTTNIRRFGYNQFPMRGNWPKTFLVDGQEFDANNFLPNNLCNLGSGWSWCTTDFANFERSPQNYGPFRQIFETNFMIVYGTQGSDDENAVALESAVMIANFFNMYGRGSPILVPSDSPPFSPVSNLLLIGGPHMNSWTAKLTNSPVTFDGTGWTLGDKTFNRPCQGSLFLTPQNSLPNFAAVIAGTDSCGLSVAMRAVPQRSGVVAPDFLVLDKSFVGRGSRGILAAGYWDNTWKFSYSSGYYA